MPLTFDVDLRLTVLRGDKDGHLKRFAPSMVHAIQACDVPFPDDLCMVTAESSSSLMKALEICAKCWHRELPYDFVPFSPYEYRKRQSDGSYFSFRKQIANDDTTRSFLWVSGKPGRWQTVGGCTFRREATYWRFQWVWIHPDYRRKGLLNSAWLFFRSMFGDFFPDPPWSPELTAFMLKKGYQEVLQRIVLDKK